MRLRAAYSDKGNDDRAVAALDAALELQPDNVEALRAAAMLDLRHERNERAVTKLEKLLSLEPDDAQAHSDLGAASQGRAASTKLASNSSARFSFVLVMRPRWLVWAMSF